MCYIYEYPKAENTALSLLLAWIATGRILQLDVPLNDSVSDSQILTAIYPRILANQSTFQAINQFSSPLMEDMYEYIKLKPEIKKLINTQCKLIDENLVIKKIDSQKNEIVDKITDFLEVPDNVANHPKEIDRVGISTTGSNFHFGVEHRQGIPSDTVIIRKDTNYINSFTAAIIMKLFNNYFNSLDIKSSTRFKITQYIASEIGLNNNCNPKLTYKEMIFTQQILAQSQHIIRKYNPKHNLYIKNQKIYYKDKKLENKLTPTENKILIKLTGNTPKHSTYEDLAKIIWEGEDWTEKFSLQAIAQHISRLRKILDELSIDEIKIKSLTNQGYKLIINS